MISLPKAANAEAFVCVLSKQFLILKITCTCFLFIDKKTILVILQKIDFNQQANKVAILVFAFSAFIRYRVKPIFSCTFLLV